MKSQMKNKIKFIEDETDKLQKFIEQNDGLVLSEANLDAFVTPQNNFSKQYLTNFFLNILKKFQILFRVLELVAENRAIIDSLMFMEKTFKKEEIDLDTLIKVKFYLLYKFGFLLK